ELTRDNDRVWSCHVVLTNRESCPIQSVAFTPLASIPLTACEQMRIALPHGAGWVVPADRLEPGHRITLNYPVHASMQWADLFFKDFGVYLACHDREPFLKQLVVERGPHDLAVFWRYSDLCIKQDDRLVLPPFVIAGHDDGWLGAARIYRNWARQWMRDPTPPEWFARCPAWFWTSLKGQHTEQPGRQYADLPKMTEKITLPDEPTAQICAWMSNGHDTDYPDFDTGDDMGGPEGLADAIEAIHQQQRRAALYVNARLIDPASGLDAPGGLLAEDGAIADIGAGLFADGAPNGAEVVDCGGMVLAPGLVDIRVQLRDPGHEHMEDIGSAGLAAAAGGVTTMVCLPNTEPVIDNVAVLEFVARRAREVKLAKIHCYAATTRGMKGNELTEFGLLGEAGAVAFTDAETAIADAKTMQRALSYASTFGHIIVQHPEEPALCDGGAMNSGEIASRLGLSGLPPVAEVIMIERDLRLVKATGGRWHAAHVSTAAGIEAIRQAKARGLKVTC
ncbi:MAG: hypothetical protein KAI80_04690, partial [Hyphomicrobiaceae bacterium]|nr:hypothetical protein [Hyphomicrobiaceae bacterium]